MDRLIDNLQTLLGEYDRKITELQELDEDNFTSNIMQNKKSWISVMLN